jgi:hypothetical protein
MIQRVGGFAFRKAVGGRQLAVGSDLARGGTADRLSYKGK